MAHRPAAAQLLTFGGPAAQRRQLQHGDLGRQGPMAKGSGARAGDEPSGDFGRDAKKS